MSLRQTVYRKAVILGGVGTVPVVLWLVTGLTEVFLAPVLLFGLPLLGLAALISVADLMFGPKPSPRRKTTETKAPGQPTRKVA